MNRMLRLVLFVLLPWFISTDPPIEEKCSIENNSFKKNEKLVYKIYYNWKMIWIPAGEVTFTVSETAEYFEYVAKGITYPSYDSFFKVRDHYSSKVDKNSMYPVSFLRKVQEGNYYRYDSIIFDQNSKKAISYWGTKAEDAEKSEYALDECMQDMLSILYYVRNYNTSQFSEGEAIPIKVFFDKRTFPLKVQFEGKEENKKIKNLGKFKTLKFSPEVVSGYVFRDNTNMSLWVSDDKNKIPLLIESPISVGSIKAVLKSHENLRYPFDAAITK